MSNFQSECPSQDDVRSKTPRTLTPTTPKVEKPAEKKKVNIGKIPEIPPFR